MNIENMPKLGFGLMRLPEGTFSTREGNVIKLERMLDTPYFQLDRLSDCQGLLLEPDAERFSVLTALSPMTLAFEDGEVKLQAGQTALLPADGYPLQVTGASALLARPAI